MCVKIAVLFSEMKTRLCKEQKQRRMQVSYHRILWIYQYDDAVLNGVIHVTHITFLLAAAQLTADEEFTGPALQETIDAAYKDTSKKLLEILFTKYQFRDHLKV